MNGSESDMSDKLEIQTVFDSKPNASSSKSRQAEASGKWVSNFKFLPLTRSIIDGFKKLFFLVKLVSIHNF